MAGWKPAPRATSPCFRERGPLYPRPKFGTQWRGQDMNGGTTQRIGRQWPSAAALAVAAALGFGLGAWQTPARSVVAQTPAGAPGSDYGQRVVAFVHGNVAITREDLGEYLIARYGT